MSWQLNASGQVTSDSGLDSEKEKGEQDVIRGAWEVANSPGFLSGYLVTQYHGTFDLKDFVGMSKKDLGKVIK